MAKHVGGGFSERNEKLFRFIQLQIESASKLRGVLTNFVKPEGLPISTLIASILARGVGRPATIASTIRRIEARSGNRILPNAHAGFLLSPLFECRRLQTSEIQLSPRRAR